MLDYFNFEDILKDNNFISIKGFSKLISNLLISRKILQLYSTIIYLFLFDIVYYINILSTSIEFSILYENNNKLTITNDYYSLRIIII